MRIIWTEKAEKQLDQIFEYIASDSSLYAHRMVGQIIEEAESIPPILEKVVKSQNTNEMIFEKFFIIHIALSIC